MILAKTKHKQQRRDQVERGPLCPPPAQSLQQPLLLPLGPPGRETISKSKSPGVFTKSRQGGPSSRPQAPLCCSRDLGSLRGETPTCKGLPPPGPPREPVFRIRGTRQLHPSQPGPQRAGEEPAHQLRAREERQGSGDRSSDRMGDHSGGPKTLRTRTWGAGLRTDSNPKGPHGPSSSPVLSRPVSGQGPAWSA